MPLTVGGGVRKIADIRNLLNAGADKVAINSAAVFTPEFVGEASQKFGNQCIVVAIDAKRVADIEVDGIIMPRWEIFTHGGRKPTGIDAVAWASKMAELGAGELLVTSMDGDGTKKGYDLALMKQITSRVNVPVIASGLNVAGDQTDNDGWEFRGVSSLAEGVLEGGVDAVLAASIFHFGEYTVQEAKAYMAAQGIQMRL